MISGLLSLQTEPRQEIVLALAKQNREIEIAGEEGEKENILNYLYFAG